MIWTQTYLHGCFPPSPNVTIIICHKTSYVGANRYIVINIAILWLKSHFKIIFLSSKLICLGRCWQTQKQIPWWQSSNFLRIMKGKLKFALHIKFNEFYNFIYLSKISDFVYLYLCIQDSGNPGPSSDDCFSFIWWITCIWGQAGIELGLNQAGAKLCS